MQTNDMDEQSLLGYAISGSADARRILADQGYAIDWGYAITHLSDGTPLCLKDIKTVDTEMANIVAEYGMDKTTVRNRLLNAIEIKHNERQAEKRMLNMGRLHSICTNGERAGFMGPGGAKRGTNRMPAKKKRKKAK